MTRRRRFLASVGALGASALAGCLGGGSSGEQRPDDPVRPSDDPTPILVETDIAPPDRSTGCANPGSPGTDDGPPTVESDLPLVDCPQDLMDEITSGGVEEDGIPSIDEPSFSEAGAADDRLDDDDPVFGVVRGDEAKAYPQEILVWHEVVNDEIAGDAITVSYCPLTGTAQGFERGSVTFGVSGQLLNSNLVMYDRATESYWPQMLARAIDGPATGGTLEEFPVHWTTWGRWSEAHPETIVLTEETGYARNYGRDPYGGYAPRTGHYANGSLLFSPYVSDFEERLQLKTVVLGARTESGAFAVEKDALREHGVLSGPVDGVDHVAVYDPGLDTGYVYHNPEERRLEYDAGSIRVDESTFAPDQLPLDRVLRYDAMWFAWYGYYPGTTLIRRDPAALTGDSE